MGQILSSPQFLDKLRAWYAVDNEEVRRANQGMAPPEVVYDPESNRLDLHNQNLARVPDEVFDLTSLKFLALHQNYITHLSPSIARLQALVMLRLFSNQLLDLPPEIGELTRLSTLDIGKNKLLEIRRELCNCVGLKEINLEWNKLSRLPPEIGLLTNLQSMNLYINKISTLPPEFGNMKALTQLDISHNCLEVLPEAIGDLTSLTVLSLVGNRFTELHPCIGNLTLLQRLDVRCNSIKCLPKELGNCINLKHLLLRMNEVQELPAETGQLLELQDARLEQNALSTLPSLKGALHLRTLHLFENALTALPEQAFDGLTSLSDLDVANNLLEQLPDSLGHLPALELLFLNDCRLSSVNPRCFEALPSLTEVSIVNNHIADADGLVAESATRLVKLALSQNPIRSLPTRLVDKHSLRVLDCALCDLAELPEAFGKLTELVQLNLGHNRLSVLPASIGTLEKLQKLYVSFNNLGSFDWPASFSKLDNLEELYIGGNRLKQLPGFVAGLPALRVLDISCNKIRAFPTAHTAAFPSLATLQSTGNKLTGPGIEPICNIVSLTELDLSHNDLSMLPSTIGDLVYLMDLDLDGNKLTELPPEMKSLRSLMFLRLSHNQLSHIPKIQYTSDVVWVLAEGNSNQRVRSLMKREGQEDDEIVLKRKERQTRKRQLSSMRETNRVRFGWAQTRGRRPDQQDTIAVVPHFRLRPDDHYAAVFDGHGGNESGQFAASNLHIAIEDILNDELRARECADGTAAVVAVILDSVLYVANAGDSRAVLSQRGRAVDMSRDHKPEDVEERRRIQSLGGFVTESKRVNGILALSRALGDCHLQPMVTYEPDVRQLELADDFEFLVLACDGLWDVMSSQEAVDVAKHARTPVQAAVRLRDAAYTLGSTDNISVCVVQFASLKTPKFKLNSPRRAIAGGTAAGVGGSSSGSGGGGAGAEAGASRARTGSGSSGSSLRQ